MTTQNQDPQEPSQPSERAPIFAKFPPPFLFVVVYFIGLIIGHEVGAAILGGFLVVVGFLIAIASFVMFIHRGTTLLPHGHPMHLVDMGPFLISRNPMYLSLVLIYAGAAIWQLALWPLILLLIPFFIMNSIVIPFEERRLRAIFGKSYEEYAGKVRRWF
jgi:protein-S-isoprenylcysteine O-methyltransferase Ste14